MGLALGRGAGGGAPPPHGDQGGCQGPKSRQLSCFQRCTLLPPPAKAPLPPLCALRLTTFVVPPTLPLCPSTCPAVPPRGAC